jgi:hypothetical protein
VHPKAIPDMLVKRKFSSTSKELEPQPFSVLPVTLLGKLHSLLQQQFSNVYIAATTLTTCHSATSFLPYQ